MKIETDQSWRTRAACIDEPPDLFFPSSVSGANYAKAICSTCTEREPCLKLAQDNGETEGVWGGVLFGEEQMRIAYEKSKQRVYAFRERKRALRNATESGSPSTIEVANKVSA